MEINFTLIILATVVQFVLGALWYSPLIFGKWWMQIMEVGHMSKEELAKMQKEMMPFYGLQFVLTLVTNWVLASNIAFNGLETGAALFFAGFMWVGFVAPVILQSIIWGNTKKKYWVKQAFVSLSYQLVAILISAYILTM